MNDVDNLLLHTIENTARRDNQLAVRQTHQFIWAGARTREFLKPLDGSQYLLDEFATRCSVLQGNIICDRIQIVNRRVSPDYSSHRSIRRFAWACVEIRPS